MKPPISIVLILIYCITLINCTNASKDQSIKLSEVLSCNDPFIKEVMDSLELYAVQIIYSEIIKDDSGNVTFKDQTFQADNQNYFYPASTVKFPIAFLALEKANTLNAISSETPFRVEGDSISTTIKKEVQKIFAVSDNQAYNRLYELLGTDYINAKMKAKNLAPCRISHRLSVKDSDNPMTKPVVFKITENDSMVIATNNNKTPKPLELNAITKGIGYYKGDSLVNEPFDFSLKNYFPLSGLHKMMKSVFFPEHFDMQSIFHLSKDDLRYVKTCMQVLPREAGYDPSEYYDSYGKFLMFGDSKNNIPNHIKIYNKVGYAYGHLTDTAYIVDEKENISFFLSATILTNRNQIFNDDNYEFESVGIPFLAQLGREIHQTMIANKKANN